MVRTIHYRVGQFLRALAARVPQEQVKQATRVLPLEAHEIFGRQAVQDQRHALEVYRTLCQAGQANPHLLAAALLHEPTVLVIDEPMVGLDPRAIRAVKNLFIEHTRSGGTVFMSTHTLDIAEAVASRIGIIHRGELVAVGKLDELRAQARRQHSLEEIFLQLTEVDDG